MRGMEEIQIQAVDNKYLMLNYNRGRESAERVGSRKSLSKGLINNKSHTSSINIKLSQDVGSMENNKLPLKKMLKDKCEPYLHSVSKNSITANYAQVHKKHSVKLQSNQKQNMSRRRQPRANLQNTPLRPFQEVNRYLQTERINKESQKSQQRSISKSKVLKIKNDLTDMKMRTQYIEHSADKYRRDSGDIHRRDSANKAAANSNKTAKVPISELKSLMDQIYKEQAELIQLKRQLDFYKRHSSEGVMNSALQALKA